MGKMSARRAWGGACKLVTGEKARGPSAEDKKSAADPDTDDECDSSARQAVLGEFRKRHRYTFPMRHRPADRLFARMARRREKRLLRCRNLKDVACIIDHDLTFSF